MTKGILYMLNDVIMYLLSFKPYVMLPLIIFTLAIVFKIRIKTAITSALTIGIGFIGIFMTIDYFVKIINPVIQALIARAGLQLNVLDVGWPPLAAITWSFKLAPLLLVLFMGINVVMLVFKLTKTVNIDIWNYWHVILAATMVFSVSDSLFLAVASSALSFILVLKLAEWSAPMVNKLSGMEGICIPHLSGIIYFPIGLLGDFIISKIPGLNQIDANPEKIQQRLGLLGEPMALGFLIGMALGFGAGYEVKQILDLAFSFSAVIFILPKMGGILGSSLIPISEGMKVFVQTKFPDRGVSYFGLDVAVLFSVPVVMVTSLLLMPVALILAFTLPGINFIPLGDLTNLLVPVAIICTATKGNIVRAFLVGIPVIIGNLYLASNLASFFTNLAAQSNYHITGYSGMFTSFLDGGNVYRGWLLQACAGDYIALFMIPLIIGLIYFTWVVTKYER